jgi:hypothetical protein
MRSHPTSFRSIAAAASVSVATLAACGSGTTSNSTATTSATSIAVAATAAPSATTTSAAAVTSVATANSTTAASVAVPAITGDTINAAVKAATEFLGTLDATKRAAAMFRYDDLAAKEASWSNFPAGAFKGRHGAMLGELTDVQRVAALAVVDSLLSDAGYQQVLGILASDDFTGSQQASGGGAKFGSANYYLAFYGEPSATTPWTMQFGGHHLVMHITVGGGVISQTPFFSGSDPMKFTLQNKAYEPMAGEVTAAFGLLKSLDPAQLAAAKIAGSIGDLVAGPQHDGKFPTPEGVPYSKLNATQQQMVKDVIALWVNDTDPAVSSQFMPVYESQLADTRIAWAGSADQTVKNAYLRIDGPRLWIEYINTGNNGGDLHAHTVYRDKKLDYGTGVA